MAQYPINPIEASKQPNGPISTTPIKVVQIQTLGPRQFSAGRPDPTPQRHASVGCVFRRACATATAPLPPQSRLASVHHPSATAPRNRHLAHLLAMAASTMRPCHTVAALPLRSCFPPRHPRRALVPPWSRRPPRHTVARRRPSRLCFAAKLPSTALLCRMESSYAAEGEVFTLQR